MAEPAQQIFYCYAPEDVIVEQLYTISGTVQKGQELAKLSSIQIRRFQTRIESLRELIDVHERPFLDGRIDKLLDTLKDEVKAAETDANAKADRLEATQEGVKVGLNTLVDLAEAQAAYEIATAKRTAARIQLAHEPGRVKDIKDKLLLTKMHIEKEAALLKEAENYLIIRAPASGSFVAEVGDKCFVKKGDQIGVIRK